MYQALGLACLSSPHLRAHLISDAILSWWRTNSSTFPAWALAARIVYAISPNSASCERVFALLKNLFGEQQMLSLADYVQAALMLNYNNRRVG